MNDTTIDSMISSLGEAICQVRGIDKQANRKKSDAQLDKVRALENEIFHFGLFSDLVEGDTKAEGKAILNSMMSERPDKVQLLHLKLTPYIFYKALSLVTESKIKEALERDSSSVLTKENVENAIEIAQKVANIMLDTINGMKGSIER